MKTETLHPNLQQIWVKRIKIYSNRWVHSLQEGDQVCVEDETIVDCVESPTHVITAVHSKNKSHFYVSAMNIKTMELSLIKL